jgi:hypothetical protein
MTDGFEAVAEAIDRVRQLLLDYGDEFTVPRLATLSDRLRNGDKTAIVSAVSEATGGMGSLNDRYLCRENDDKIEPHEVYAVNVRLTSFVKDVETTARAAAAANGIRLTR